MPIPERTKLRYKAQSKFKLQDRVIHKPTGDIYLVGPTRNVYECIMVRIQPLMGRAAVSWKKLLEEFEHEQST